MIVRIMGTDVVLPAVAKAQTIPTTEILVPFGGGKNFNYIPAHQIAFQLGPRPTSAALLQQRGHVLHQRLTM